MLKEPFLRRITNFVFTRLFKIDDSAQKIALGVGLGVFSGLIPGTGPAAALFLAFVFHANRAAALLGGIITNTWLSIVIFILAVKAGSLVFNRHWQEVYQKAQEIVSNFHWGGFLRASFLDVILPVITGYLIIGLLLGLISYLVVFFVAKKILHKD